MKAKKIVTIIICVCIGIAAIAGVGIAQFRYLSDKKAYSPKTPFNQDDFVATFSSDFIKDPYEIYEEDPEDYGYPPRTEQEEIDTAIAYYKMSEDHAKEYLANEDNYVLYQVECKLKNNSQEKIEGIALALRSEEKEHIYFTGSFSLGMWVTVLPQNEFESGFEFLVDTRYVSDEDFRQYLKDVVISFHVQYAGHFDGNSFRFSTNEIVLFTCEDELE